MNDVDGLASGNGGCPIAQHGSTELVNVSRAADIEERIGIFYFDGLGDGGNREDDRNFLR